MKKLIVLLAAFAMVGAFVATAMADVSLYGSARFRTYWTSADEDTQYKKPLPHYDDNDLEWRMGHLSRFGAKFKSDKITGRFELDARAGSKGTTETNGDLGGASSLGNMRLRLLWGQYDFGGWKLMIGQNYPLYNFIISGINYYSGGFEKWGGMAYHTFRTSQLRLTFGDFRVALMSADTGKTPVGSDGVTDIDLVFPKVEIRYDMKVDPVKLSFVGGWQTYDVVGATDNSTSVQAWVLGAVAKANFGAFYVNGGVTYRENGGNYGAWTTVNETAIVDVTTDNVEDVDTWGIVVALGYKINDMVTVEGSYGWLQSNFDFNDHDDDASALGLLAKFTVAPGVYIIPEYIYQDNGDGYWNGDEVDQGTVNILGVFWRIDFK